MGSIGERLVAHWLSDGIITPPGVPEGRLRAFEQRYGVTLPKHLRDYLLVVDGMGSRSESDGDWFSFWPIEDIVRCDEEYEETIVEDQSSYFVFADHSIVLPAFAIHLTPSGDGPHQVIAIYPFNGVYSIKVVARSFDEFVERYLANQESRLALV